jgi:hypothetical protein
MVRVVRNGITDQGDLAVTFLSVSLASVLAYTAGLLQWFIFCFVGAFAAGLGLCLEKPLAMSRAAGAAFLSLLAWPVRAFRAGREAGRESLGRFRPAMAGRTTVVQEEEIFRAPPPPVFHTREKKDEPEAAKEPASNKDDEEGRQVSTIVVGPQG